MKQKLKIIIPILLALGVVLAAALYLRHQSIPVLQPKGIIGQKEHGLMIFTVILGFAVIIPVFIMAIAIAYRYREGNTNTRVKYTPEWDTHRVAEFIWWGIPIAIIAVLSVVTWVSTHQLDPWKPVASTQKKLTVQVVSLDWKWLFIYPEQHIATVNFVQFPAGTPLDFEITSDTVMNSFWIPQLGGQIYAMPGMVTQLNLEATNPGSYNGSSANISGSGFAGMKFTAKSSSLADFNAWVQSVKHSKSQLTAATYSQLARPSEDNQPAYYNSTTSSLYDTIVLKYMMPLQHMSGNIVAESSKRGGY